jgi:hypothetical protein
MIIIMMIIMMIRWNKGRSIRPEEEEKDEQQQQEDPFIPKKNQKS